MEIQARNIRYTTIALPATIRNTTDSELFKRLLKSLFYNRSFDITA